MSEAQERRKIGREWAKELSDRELIEKFDRLGWAGQMKEVLAEEIAVRFLASLEEDNRDGE